MFKKTKSNKNLTPSSTLTLEEMLSDLETFQVDVTAHSTNNKNADSATAPATLESWWNIFEQFLVDLKCLEMVHTEIEGYKIKLESQRLEIETETKILENEIEEQQHLINDISQ